MKSYSSRSTLIICLLLVCVLGASSQSTRKRPSQQAPPENPKVQQVINRAEEHFKLGQLRFEENRKKDARVEFDKSLDSILESGLDVRAEPRLQAYYTELIERIYRIEVPVQPGLSEVVNNQPGPASATHPSPQPGFREQKFEPSPLDELSRLVLTPEENAPMRPVHPNLAPRSLNLKMEAPSERPVSSTKEILKRVEPSVVVIHTAKPTGRGKKLDTFLGSGFFVAPDVIATNYHVIRGARAIVVKSITSGESFVFVKVLNYDAGSDVALIQVMGRGTPSAPLGDSRMVERGDDVLVIGNPRGLEGTLTKGVISGLRIFGGVPIIQFSAPISGGSSGGPVINDRGQVIGIATFTITNGQLINFAVPVSALLNISR